MRTLRRWLRSPGLRFAACMVLVAAGAVALQAGAHIAHAADGVIDITLGGVDDASSMHTVGPLTTGHEIVPGDAETWSIQVHNAGESMGYLTAEIVDVHVSGAPDEQFGREFAIVSRPVGELADRRTLVFAQSLGQGETTSFEFGYEFPESATSGNHPRATAEQVTFSVLLILRGAPAKPSPPPGNGLAASGTEALGIAGIGGVALVVGSWLWALGRRRRSSARPGGSNAEDPVERAKPHERGDER